MDVFSLSSEKMLHDFYSKNVNKQIVVRGIWQKVFLMKRALFVLCVVCCLETTYILITNSVLLRRIYFYFPATPLLYLIISSWTSLRSSFRFFRHLHTNPKCSGIISKNIIPWDLTKHLKIKFVKA